MVEEQKRRNSYRRVGVAMLTLPPSFREWESEKSSCRGATRGVLEEGQVSTKAKK